MLVVHSRIAPKWFNEELNLIDPGLRLVWGREKHGIERWVIERQIPPEMHAFLLEDFSRMYPGEERYFDQKLTDDSGKITGVRYFDRVPEYALGHIVQDDTFDLDDVRGYREPDRRDLDSIKRWLFEFKDVQEQMRVMKDEYDKKQEANKKERIECLSRDIIDSHELWEKRFSDAPATIMEGTEI